MDDNLTAELTAHEYSEYMAEQLAIAKAVDVYKQGLIEFLNQQFQDCIDEDIIGADYNDPWIGGKEYAFELVMEFVTK